MWGTESGEGCAGDDWFYGFNGLNGFDGLVYFFCFHRWERPWTAALFLCFFILCLKLFSLCLEISTEFGIICIFAA